MASVVRIAGGLASVPLSFVAEQLQGWATGPNAVLDLRVSAVQDTAERQALFRRLRRAAADPNVAGVLLRIEQAPGGWAACQDLRSAIAAVRRAGRAVYGYVESPGNKEIWIASACDRVIQVPIGEVALVGVGVELTFFGAALGRLGVTPDFEAAGAYKSFGEPYTRSFASPSNHEALRHLVDDLQRQLVAGIAEGRGKTVEEVEALVGRGPLSAEEALSAGLVDTLMYEDQLVDWLQQHHGSRSKRIEFVSWARRDGLLEWLGSWGESGRSVAVLHLQGPIVVEERGTAHAIGARKVVPMIRQLQEDDDVGAVVLHVNSPGGSVLASDLLWREVDKLREKKVVVACFEDVAASGGYYLSAPATEIIARPGTLTGSIGVFGGKLVAGEGLRKLGVHSQEVSAGPNATLFSPSKPFTDAQRDRFRGSLQRFYDGFVTRVATGRKRSEEVIEPHCRGRVWTGRAAQERGLVDREGDLEFAVDRARSLAGLQAGAFVRRDLSPRRQGLIARLIRKNLGEVLPMGQMSWMVEVVERVAGPRLGPLIAVLLQHEGEALAMLPGDLEPR